MSAYTIITLDTQAPVISFDTPVRDGSYIVVPYIIDEPDIFAAELNGTIASIGSEAIRAQIELAQGGSVTVRAFLLDDVGNSQTVEAELWLAPVAGEVVKDDPSSAVVEGLGGIINKAQRGRLETPDEGTVD